MLVRDSLAAAIIKILIVFSVYTLIDNSYYAYAGIE